MLRVISLGAGVQSTTMALMAAHGQLGHVDAAIFADTGWEPKAVYRHFEWLKSVLPFPVHTVSAGDLRRDVLNRSKSPAGRVAAVPWFMRMPDGKAAMGRRQCTKEYKLRPIQRKIVEMLGGKRPKGGANVMVGISTDEAARAKPSQVQYIHNTHPLLERDLSRRGCLGWLEREGYPEPPKSACVGCPFHNDAMWRDMKANAPEEFADAIEVDTAIRHQPGFRGEQYIHRSMKPLSEVDFSTAEDRGQLNMFNNECEGMCGV